MNAIEIKGLTKNYKKFSLDNLNLTLPSGCIMGLIGKNGAGKSTTIKLLLNIIQKNSGTIILLDKDSTNSLNKNDIGIVLDDIGLPGNFKAKQINSIMKSSFVNWDENYFYELLQKLSVPTNKKCREFSRGMKMKMQIAMALSHKPKLLILDEATNGLDPAVRDEVLDLFNEFTRDESHSILISSHIVSDLEKICDYIAFLDNGKLILCEEKDRLYEEYVVIHCTKEQLEELMPESIVGKKVNSYGAEALVKKDMIPSGFETGRVGIEELFVFMVKEDKAV